MLNVNTDRETEALTRASLKAEASQLRETPSTGVVECFNKCSVAVAARPDTKQALVLSPKVEEEQWIPEAIVVREIKGPSEKSCPPVDNMEPSLAHLIPATLGYPPIDGISPSCILGKPSIINNNRVSKALMPQKEKTHMRVLSKTINMQSKELPYAGI